MGSSRDSESLVAVNNDSSLLNPIPVHSLLELAPRRSPEWVRSGVPGTWKLLRLVMDVQFVRRMKMVAKSPVKARKLM